MQYENIGTLRRPNLTSILTSTVGGLFLILAILRTVQNAYLGWSPTKTAKKCFPFPEAREAPTYESAGRMILSALFFGSDSLYFDAGDENTGISDPLTLNPAGNSADVIPQTPLDEPKIDITNLYSYDYSLLPSGCTALLPYDLSQNPEKGEILLSNTTAYNIDIEKLSNAEYPVKTALSEHSEKNPLVLIVHTHGTEAYSPEGATYISSGDVHRSSDTAKNMIAVGEVMAEILNASGIPTLHCKIMHDLESYQRSYDLAADTIQKYLAEYPSIKYVFDVHRDAIVSSDGSYIRPVTAVNGEVTAQIMLLVGTNEKGADHPTWEQNFTVAAKLQRRLTEKYDRFARPINIRGASFNEQFTPGSLLIEVGSAANSLSEAKSAAKHLTYAIADMIKEESK